MSKDINLLQRPVQLQLNNSGSWKTLAKFDADNADACDKARTIGQLLGRLGDARTKLRIATDAVLPIVLLRWDSTNGWWEVQGHRQWER